MQDRLTRLPLEGVHNLRDLGGYRRHDASRTATRRVYRGCALRNLSDRGANDVVALGIATVIDLRSQSERDMFIRHWPQHVALYHMPLFDTLAPAFDSHDGAPPGDLRARYKAAIATRDTMFADIFRIIAAAPPAPVLFHCTAGKDRTGLVAALMLALCNVTQDEIADDYARTGREAAPLVAEISDLLRARACAPDVIGRLTASDAAIMQDVLQDLTARHGSVRAYLHRAGLSEADMDKIATRLA